MVKIKVNVKTKNDSIPSDTTKRKMPVITNPKIRRTPRRDDTNVGDIRVKVKFQKDTVKASPTLENPDVIIDPLNIELIADALDVSGGTRFHFPKDDSKGIKITFYDKELLLSEALLMPKLDY